MHVADPLAADEFVGQAPWSRHEKSDAAEEFRIPIKKLVQNIEQNVANGTAIIDRRLAALRAIVSGQFGAAVFAMGKGRQLFALPASQPAALGFPLDRGNR